VPEQIKKRRLAEIIDLQRKHSGLRNQRQVGQIQKVLVEGDSKKSSQQHFGRNDSNKIVVFDKKEEKVGDYVFVKITNCTTGTLMGEIVS
jgi:tRNA-2-methylthio-N6-dimethylallyladenosine synthase